ncbi:PTS IIA-like nitrogen-regulatory protein PtsN [Desulfacinum hydrothermale DSM 13146]|uniref:PTS IIA-like nitrogen-regulatory protein PtsN n=1 Tax=Desulfacinum hydrothermale DSM 13146 TaxID=1121390 RepID=A0A1W1XRZ9_9BACT|nr:PTS sugar transporter subunit IIA [Desulfacinum hydrothermale]SMC26634.1 PTS IIA-like nitrogen-regulatory protein PtsN [Desulfacinum hydrothermale DSM 13146]
MKILDILPKEAIIPELGATTKRQVLEELTDALLKCKPHLDRHRLLEVLLERERLGSTGIGDGIAIPHGKIEDLDQLILSFGRSSAGIDFESMDGKPAHIFFLLVAPENCAGIHLRALAKIARLLNNSGVRKRLQTAASRDEIYAIIRQEDDAF